MKIAVVGPSELTDFDKKEIEENLQDFIAKGNEIVLLAYRSIEIEVFKFFVKNIDSGIADKLHIYTFQNFEYLPNKIKTSVEYLVDNGANCHSFEHDEMLVKRNLYVNAWNHILQDVDITICFYDGEKPTLMIPIDITKELDKKAVIYQLPRNSHEQHLLEPNEKIRVVENSNEQ